VFIMTQQVRIGRWLLLATLIGLLPIVGGCGSGPYLSGYSYYPQPAVVNVARKDAPNQIPLTVLASVLGIRNADKEHHVPYSIDVRLRFESNGPAEVVFDPATLDLVTGTLRPFPPPRVQPPNVITLHPGDRQDVNATFPLASDMSPDRMNLSNLRLRWVVRVGGYPVPQTALFERAAGSYGPPPDSGDLSY
jgi:hypothetical protein